MLGLKLYRLVNFEAFFLLPLVSLIMSVHLLESGGLHAVGVLVAGTSTADLWGVRCILLTQVHSISESGVRLTTLFCMISLCCGVAVFFVCTSGTWVNNVRLVLSIHTLCTQL